MARQQTFGITPAALKARLKDAPAGAYLFCGPEEMLKRFYLDKFIALIEKEGMADFNLARLDFSAGAVPDDLERELAVLPVMARHRMILCTSMPVKDMKQEDAERMGVMLSDFPEDVILICYLEDEELPSDYKLMAKKSVALLREKMIFCHFPLQDAATLAAWSAKILAKDGLTIDRAAVQTLIRLCDSRMAAMRGELEKLACYCIAKGKKTVTEEEVLLFARDSREFAIWDLCDAIVGGALRPAENYYQNLIRQKTDPLIISAAVSRLLTNCLLIAEGADKETVKNLTGLKDFVYERYSRALYGKKKEDVVRAMDKCAALDRALKNGAVDGAILCEETVLTVTRILGGAK